MNLLYKNCVRLFSLWNQVAMQQCLGVYGVNGMQCLHLFWAIECSTSVKIFPYTLRQNVFFKQLKMFNHETSHKTSNNILFAKTYYICSKFKCSKIIASMSSCGVRFRIEYIDLKEKMCWIQYPSRFILLILTAAHKMVLFHFSRM